MRSIIFTSFLCVAGMAQAQMPEGCFGRAYSSDHLEAREGQHVAALMLRVGAADQSQLADIYARIRDVVGGADAGDYREYLYCAEFDGQPGCGGECDGGFFTLVKEAEAGLLIETDYLRLVGAEPAEGCGGFGDLAEQGKLTRYALAPLPDAACDIVFGPAEGS